MLTLNQSELGSDGNEGVLCIPQSSSITGASSSDCSVSYPGHSLGKSYPSAEMQSMYSTASVNWATRLGEGKNLNLDGVRSWKIHSIKNYIIVQVNKQRGKQPIVNFFFPWHLQPSRNGWKNQFVFFWVGLLLHTENKKFRKVIPLFKYDENNKKESCLIFFFYWRVWDVLTHFWKLKIRKKIFEWLKNWQNDFRMIL